MWCIKIQILLLSLFDCSPFKNHTYPMKKHSNNIIRLQVNHSATCFHTRTAASRLQTSSHLLSPLSSSWSLLRMFSEMEKQTSSPQFLCPVPGKLTRYLRWSSHPQIQNTAGNFSHSTAAGKANWAGDWFLALSLTPTPHPPSSPQRTEDNLNKWEVSSGISGSTHVASEKGHWRSIKQVLQIKQVSW